MTSEERRRIAGCRIAVVGVGEFIDSIKAELQQLGFVSIQIISSSNKQPAISNFDVIAENVNEGSSCMSQETDIPLILPFDFVNGAGVIVVMPDDERDIICKPELRQWAATYMAGYCAFWNVEGCEWLRDSLPDIKNGVTSGASLKTAAYICARIAANIAVGREVKHFPRFYLCKNLE
ncbi:hypothetical protein [uncultured Duncaniella sp.]|uniref:hypothetical protein n=1 Tax=uncultured Duncaniella sp. TaxID=2768039 RepID=UPI00260F27A8|nr:hypothetical protein [uncultured Duncaniella sp.]